MDWINLAEDRNKCWAFVNMVVNFKFHKMQGIPLIAENPFGCQQKLCSVELVG
jgi:hypothetical protein